MKKVSKKMLNDLLDVFLDLNKKSDIDSSTKSCILILYLQNVGHNKLAELLPEGKYDEARKYIEELEY